MPNDPRHKFKKQVYDLSRNIMYYSTGGGGSGAGGGDSGGGVTPRKPPTPTIYVPPGPGPIPVPGDNPVYPIRPFPTPFDPRPNRPPGIVETLADRARLRLLAEIDARNRARIVPISQDDIFNDILVDDATPDIKPARPNVNDIFGQSTPVDLAAGGKGKPPPKFKIKEIDLTNLPLAKIPKKLIDPKAIDPNAQGTPREQLDYLNQQKQIADGKTAISQSLDKTSPLEARIAGKMYEMKMGGATEEAMNAMAKQMREQRGRFLDFLNKPDSASTSASSSAKSTPERSFIETNIEMINDELKNPTLSRQEVVEFNKMKSDFENQLKMLADEKTVATLKEAAAKLELKKTSDLEAAAKSLKITKEELAKGMKLQDSLNEQRDLAKFINEELAKPKSAQEVQILKQQKLDVDKNIIKIKREIEDHIRKIDHKLKKVENVAAKEISKPTQGKSLSERVSEKVFGKKAVVETPKISRALQPKPKPAQIVAQEQMNIDAAIKASMDTPLAPRRLPANQMMTEEAAYKRLGEIRKGVQAAQKPINITEARTAFENYDLQVRILDRMEALDAQLLRIDLTATERTAINDALDTLTDKLATLDSTLASDATLAAQPRPREGSLTTQTLEDSLALDRAVEEMTARQQQAQQERQAAPVEPVATEIGSLGAQNYITKFNEYYDSIVSPTTFDYGFEMPEIPESIKAQGELAVKKYVAEKAIEFLHEPGKPGLRKMQVVRGERVPAGKLISRERIQHNLELNYNRAVAQKASLPARTPAPPTETPGPSPPPTPPEFNREVEMQSTSQRRALMDTLTRSNYERVDILDTIDELGGNEARGGRLPLDEPIEIGDLAGVPSRTGRIPTTEISPPSSGSITPSNESSGSRTPIEGEGLGTYKPLNPLEMETVPLDNIGIRARPGKGKAPIKAPVKAPQAKLKLPSGRQIQDVVNINVSSKFTNVNAGASKFGSTLRALGERVPVLKPPSINTIRGIAGHPVTVTATSIGIGIGVSYLMAEYFKAHPATNKFDMYAQQFAVGVGGAFAGTFFTHVVRLAGQMGGEILTSAGGLAVAGSAAASLGEAVVITAAVMVTEYAVEKAMRKYKFSHAASNAAAAATSTVGLTIYGAVQGGPPGAIIMALFGAYNIYQSVTAGQEQDREEFRQAIANADTADAVNGARKQLLMIMSATNNNDYDTAFAQLSDKNKKALNERPAEENETFKNTLKYELDPLLKSRGSNPYIKPADNTPKPDEVSYESVGNGIVEGLDTAGTKIIDVLTLPIDLAIDRDGTIAREEKLKNDAYNDYIDWYVKSKFDPYYAKDNPRPTGEGVDLLDKDTLYSWRSGAEMSGELAYRQSYVHAMVVSEAKQRVVHQWIRDTRTMGEIEDKDIVDAANLDKDFADAYEKYIVTDAAAQLTRQFNQFGTNYRDADPRLVAVASKNTEALPALDHYYQVMTTLSRDTGLSIAELARLNALPIDEQNKEMGKINAVRETILRGGLIKDKATVDEFNAALIREMSSYGDNFELIMQNINDHEMLMGGSYLYAMNKSDLYRQLHLEAPVLVIDNPYAAFTELDYNKNRTPNDTLVYGYRYNLVDEQNQELEDYIQALNKTKNGGANLTDITERAQFIYDRDKDRYIKGDAEVAKDLNMSLEEYYAEYGYNKRPNPNIAVKDYTNTPVAEPDPQEVIDAELERQRQYDAAQVERERLKLLQLEAEKKLIVNGVEVDTTLAPIETTPSDYNIGETDAQKAERQNALNASKADNRTLAERQNDPNDRYYIPPQVPESQRALITQQQQVQYNKERNIQATEEKPKNNFQVIDGRVVNVGPNTRIINGIVYDELPIVETPQEVFAPTKPTTETTPRDSRTLAERQNDPNDRFYIPPQLASSRAMITQQQQLQYDAEMRDSTKERPSSSIKTEMTARPTAPEGYVKPPDSDTQTPAT